MATLITIHVVLISIVIIILVIGFFLPRQKSARRSIELNASPEEIWSVVTNHELQPRWRTGLKKVKVLEHTPDGEVWSEFPVNGPAMTFRTLKAMPPVRCEIGMEKSKGFTIRRVLEFEQLNIHATRISIEEYADIKNPFTRVLAYLQFDPAEAIDRYLSDLTTEITRLAARLESQTS
jgi:uncharacterized protein YndB with AHSA1/START domain